MTVQWGYDFGYDDGAVYAEGLAKADGTIVALKGTFDNLASTFAKVAQYICVFWKKIPPEVKAAAFIDTIGGFDGSQAKNLRRWKRNCRKRGYDRRIYKAGCRILRGER